MLKNKGFIFIKTNPLEHYSESSTVYSILNSLSPPSCRGGKSSAGTPFTVGNNTLTSIPIVGACNLQLSLNQFLVSVKHVASEGAQPIVIKPGDDGHRAAFPSTVLGLCANPVVVNPKKNNVAKIFS